MESVKAYVDCSNFLSRLVGMGAAPFHLLMLEDAYWTLLQKPTAGRWDNETPFVNNNGAAVDFPKIVEAFQDFSDLAPERLNVMSDAFYSMVHVAAGLVRSQPLEGDLKAKVKNFSLGTFLRCASFIALARGAGVYETRQAELEQITMEAATP